MAALFLRIAVHYRHFGYGTGSFQLFPNHAAGHVCHVFLCDYHHADERIIHPINSMPEWAQAITIANPLKYFIQVTRMVYLKGSGFDDLIMQFIALLFMAIMLNGWAVFSYKKNS